MRIQCRKIGMSRYKDIILNKISDFLMNYQNFSPSMPQETVTAQSNSYHKQKYNKKRTP